MQLTRATVEAAPTLGTRAEHLQQLERQALARLYMDGPHHDDPEHRARDAAKVEAMEDLGYVVIRFGHTQDWEEIVRNYPYVFGGES